MGKINEPPCSRTTFATFWEESLYKKQSILEYFLLQRITCARQQTLFSTAGWLKIQRTQWQYENRNHDGNIDDDDDYGN